MIDELTVEELANLKSHLNAASDELTRRIHKFEEDLKVLGFGVQAWIKISDNSKTELGYIKYNGVWRVVIRYDDYGEYKINILAETSRALRVYGYKHIDKLIPAIEKAAQGLLNRINSVLNQDDSVEIKEEH